MYRVKADIIYLTGFLAGIVIKDGFDVPYPTLEEAAAAARAVASRKMFTSCVTGDTYEKASPVYITA